MGDLIGENGAKFHLDTPRVNKVKVGDTVAPSTNVNVLCNVEKVDKDKITLTTVAQGVYVDKPYFNEDVQWLVISTNSL